MACEGRVYYYCCGGECRGIVIVNRRNGQTVMNAPKEFKDRCLGNGGPPHTYIAALDASLIACSERRLVRTRGAPQ